MKSVLTSFVFMMTLLSLQNSFAYECIVACTATFRSDLGFFTGTGDNCAAADQAALAQCQQADPNFYPMEGGCTSTSTSASYTRRCETNYQHVSKTETVYGSDSTDVQASANEMCQSFCSSYSFPGGKPAGCEKSAGACKP
jgi:hypothetical protein